MTKLGDIGKVVTGKTPLTSDKENYGEGYMFIGPSDLHVNMVITDSEKHITRKGIESIGNNSIDGLSVLVGCIGWDMGNVALVEGKCATNQQINALTCFNNKVNPYYIYYWLKGKKEFLFKKANVTRTPILNKSDFSNIEIELPSLEIQNKIANTLKMIDLKIENNNRTNMELESMAKTIYDYWFLQFEFPNEDGKPYKSSGGKMVWNEELKRAIPEGWKCDILKEYINLTKGISYTRENIKSGKGIPMINLASIDINRNYKPNELKFYEGEYNYEKEVYSEDMLIACTDLTRNANIVGSPILVPNIAEKYLYSMDLAKLNLLTEELEPMYIYMTLRTEYYHNYIKGFATGTNVMHLNTEGIGWFKICFPDKGIQKKFSALIKEIHKKKCKIIKENQELISLRDFLLPLLMNGQAGFKE